MFHEEDEEKKDEEKNILITEIKPTEYQEVQFEVDVEQGEDSLSEEESVELKDLVVEPIEAEPKEEDYDTDLEIEGEYWLSTVGLYRSLTSDFILVGLYCNRTLSL